MFSIHSTHRSSNVTSRDRCARSLKRTAYVFLSLLLLLSLPGTRFGQAYFGTVTGVLTDSSGGILQGAKVTLTDQNKGYVFNATSDNTGRYLFTAIPPGLYSV